ncbi:Dolichyl-diphosphooligosaccharide--protein glycosyltransferase 48 kDa subunit [Camellia lanceoleosa]|uniref:Dolichyl-diphosphooligosaccharide--protein glycosyltransferase 48 kDa subunit n=1 Tax=Camellia lanceoleosa TaxID=1840588 RepID=A0ACC0IB32_9ERIC|nr:Dolichyl-diphosphooligosaccharide--protein glycosyltransferase 48 kDa subunit [Camellia lanceoleosa]
MYDGLVLFAPNTERFGGSLDLAVVLDFVDSGHDLILSADVNASDLIRNIAAECGVDFDEHQYKHRGSHTFKFEFENPNTHLRMCHTAVGQGSHTFKFENPNTSLGETYLNVSH